MTINKLHRWWQRRGFGIESKTDFAFLHDVLREETPYYAYLEWQRDYPHATQEERSLSQLLFRISNHLQPSAVSIHGNADSLTTHAIKQGCRKTTVNTSYTPYFKLSCTDFSARLESGMIVEYAPSNEHPDSIAAIVLTHIDTSNAALWQRITAIPTITYDMRHTGIALLRKGRYPEHYHI